MPKKTPKPPASKAWLALTQRHQGCRHLQHETLYSLTEGIVTRLKKRVPGFLSPADERFELDLARTASFGFFRRQPLGMSEADPEEANTAHHLADVDSRIKEMLGEEYRSAGVPANLIEKRWEHSSRLQEAIRDRGAAYVGWLVTNAEFRHELAKLRRKWERSNTVPGMLPQYPHWPFFDAGPAYEWDARAAFREPLDAFWSFYERWGLDCLLTWDWPSPMEPDLVGGMLVNRHQLHDAGIGMFIPWYVIRGETRGLKELFRLKRQVDTPRHLRPWVERRVPKGRKLGDERLARLGWLYRFLVLALRQRYPEQCRRRHARLDHVFADVFITNAESIRQERQVLDRSLRSK